MGLALTVLRSKVFHTVRRVYGFFQGVRWMLNGTYFWRWRCRRLHNYQWSAQLMDVWYRHKIDVILEENSPDNFIYTHHGFVNPECVLRDNVTLYAIDLHEAVFVEVDESIDVCSGDVAGFVNEGQFLHAKRIYIMPISSLNRLARRWESWRSTKTAYITR